MKFYITECSDDTAMLMSDVGQVVAMFSSYDEAVTECANWVEENSYANDDSEFFFEQ